MKCKSMLYLQTSFCTRTCMKMTPLYDSFYTAHLSRAFNSSTVTLLFKCIDLTGIHNHVHRNAVYIYIYMLSETALRTQSSSHKYIHAHNCHTHVHSKHTCRSATNFRIMVLSITICLYCQLLLRSPISFYT